MLRMKRNGIWYGVLYRLEYLSIWSLPKELEATTSTSKTGPAAEKAKWTIKIGKMGVEKMEG